MSGEVITSCRLKNEIQIPARLLPLLLLHREEGGNLASLNMHSSVTLHVPWNPRNLSCPRLTCLDDKQNLFHVVTSSDKEPVRAALGGAVYVVLTSFSSGSSPRHDPDTGMHPAHQASLAKALRRCSKVHATPLRIEVLKDAIKFVGSPLERPPEESQDMEKLLKRYIEVLDTYIPKADNFAKLKEFVTKMTDKMAADGSTDREHLWGHAMLKTHLDHSVNTASLENNLFLKQYIVNNLAVLLRVTIHPLNGIHRCSALDNAVKGTAPLGSGQALVTHINDFVQQNQEAETLATTPVRLTVLAPQVLNSEFTEGARRLAVSTQLEDEVSPFPHRVSSLSPVDNLKFHG